MPRFMVANDRRTAEVLQYCKWNRICDLARCETGASAHVCTRAPRVSLSLLQVVTTAYSPVGGLPRTSLWNRETGGLRLNS
jgi:hypothetical protein